MPEFLHNGKLYYNPVEFAMDQIGGTWKMPILWRLRDEVLRYSEIKSTLPRITHKMLSTQLRSLEENGFITRKVYAVVPPKTEYTITEKGLRVIPLIEAIRAVGVALMEDAGIDVSYYRE